MDAGDGGGHVTPIGRTMQPRALSRGEPEGREWTVATEDVQVLYGQDGMGLRLLSLGGWNDRTPGGGSHVRLPLNHQGMFQKTPRRSLATQQEVRGCFQIMGRVEEGTQKA